VGWAGPKQGVESRLTIRVGMFHMPAGHFLALVERTNGRPASEVEEPPLGGRLKWLIIAGGEAGQWRNPVGLRPGFQTSVVGIGTSRCRATEVGRELLLTWWLATP
jgi:hypothetical protein